MADPDGSDVYEECPYCGAKKLLSRIGTHLYEEHWEEIGVQEGDSSANDLETAEPLHTATLDDGYVYVPREIIEEFDLEDGGLVRWYLSADGEVSVEFDHQRHGVFDDAEIAAPMGGDGQETHDLAGAERSGDFQDTEFAEGFGRWEDRDDLFRECPICGSEVYEGKVGGHLDRHWEEIVELAEQREE